MGRNKSLVSAGCLDLMYCRLGHFFIDRFLTDCQSIDYQEVMI